MGGVQVDFVCEDDVGEDRPGREHHLPAAGRRIFLDDVGAGDVGRHQVRGELNPVELQLEDARQRVNQQRLGQPRDANDEAVATDEERQQHQLNGVTLTDDELLELRDNLIAAVLHPIGQRHVIRGLDIDDLLRHTLHGASLSKIGNQGSAQGSGLKAVGQKPSNMLSEALA